MDRVDGPELIAAVRAAASGVDGLLRSLDRTDAMTVGGEWTVRETAVHLIAGANLYTCLLAGAPSPILDRTDNRPLNAGAFLALTENRPAVLADLLAAAVDRLTATAAAIAPDEIRAWHRGLSWPAAVHLGLVLAELLMHGTDVARAAGRSWTGDEGAARLAWRTLAPWQIPGRFMPEAGADVRASFALAVPGCPPLAFRIEDGAVVAVDPAGNIGCWIEGDPMPMLWWFFQRDPWPGSGLRAIGPESDLAARLADMLRRI